MGGVPLHRPHRATGAGGFDISVIFT